MNRCQEKNCSSLVHRSNESCKTCVDKKKAKLRCMICNDRRRTNHDDFMLPTCDSRGCLKEAYQRLHVERTKLHTNLLKKQNNTELKNMTADRDLYRQRYYDLLEKKNLEEPIRKKPKVAQTPNKTRYFNQSDEFIPI
jgi:hypothetical protein